MQRNIWIGRDEGFNPMAITGGQFPVEATHQTTGIDRDNIWTRKKFVSSVSKHGGELLVSFGSVRGFTMKVRNKSTQTDTEHNLKLRTDK